LCWNLQHYRESNLRACWNEQQKHTIQKVCVGVHCIYMEGENLNQNQNTSEQTAVEPKPLPKISFIPSELLKKIEVPNGHELHERCALLGLILGTIAVVSWVVILFGVVYSILGIILSIIGLKSARQKWAKIGLVLSIIGLLLSVWYVFAAYNGMINYNYFTSEFWTK